MAVSMSRKCLRLFFVVSSSQSFVRRQFSSASARLLCSPICPNRIFQCTIASLLNLRWESLTESLLASNFRMLQDSARLFIREARGRSHIGHQCRQSELLLHCLVRGTSQEGGSCVKVNHFAEVVFDCVRFVVRDLIPTRLDASWLVI